MIKRLTLFVFLATVITAVRAQDLTKFHIYHPEANASKEIEDVVKEAKKAGKHVLIQVGGNWCIWCARFNDFVNSDPSLDSIVKADYIVYHLNWSKENKNDAILAKYKFPQRFGFPVFLVLDQKGDLLHTQNSSYLEEGKSYSKEKVAGFFADWSPAAIDPANYKEHK
jgi:thioredoxin-related protein